MKRTTPGFIALTLLCLPMAVAAGGRLTPAPADKQQITHVLNRLAFGPKPGDVERVQKMGLQQYIDQQLHPESLSDTRTEDRVFHLASLRISREELFKAYPDPQQLARQLGLMGANQNAPDAPDQAAIRAQIQKYMADNMLQRPQQLLQELVSNKIVRAVESERQLQEVMTDFWFNHFNVYWDKGADRWLTTDFETNVIRPRVFGKFKDLLLATAQSPAMLFYLDNHLSSAPAPQIANRLRANTKRMPGINENYARELMELHTLGVDGGYTQKDVTEIARALTGWTIDRPRMSAEFLFRPAMHDRGEKIVLGHRLAANRGIQDGMDVLEILANNPSTARFLATKLVRRFVSDNPPQALVDKVAATYTKTDGDIREMLRTIFSSEEFLSPAVYGQKMKTPLEYVASAIRALGGETAGNPQLGRAIGQMGQPLYQYQAPTGFPDRTDYWTSDGALVARLNFAVSLTSGRLPDTRVHLDDFKDAQAAALHLGSPEFQKR